MNIQTHFKQRIDARHSRVTVNRIYSIAELEFCGRGSFWIDSADAPSPRLEGCIPSNVVAKPPVFEDHRARKYVKAEDYCSKDQDQPEERMPLGVHLSRQTLAPSQAIIERRAASLSKSTTLAGRPNTYQRTLPKGLSYRLILSPFQKRDCPRQLALIRNRRSPHRPNREQI